jgi:hypothetical protein
LSIIDTIKSKIDHLTLTALELSIVVAGAADLVLGMGLITSVLVGLGTGLAGYLLAKKDPSLLAHVDSIETQVKNEIKIVEDKLIALKAKYNS